jgi:hypothetical protein
MHAVPLRIKRQGRSIALSTNARRAKAMRRDVALSYASSSSNTADFHMRTSHSDHRNHQGKNPNDTIQKYIAVSRAGDGVLQIGTSSPPHTRRA